MSCTERPPLVYRIIYFWPILEQILIQGGYLMKRLTLSALVTKAKRLTPISTGVVHPVTKGALEGVIESVRDRLILPILIGPKHKILKAAQGLPIDISQFEIINTEHSHAAAEQAVELARAGKVSMLMKGSLHTAEFMHPIVAKYSGLHTARRMSHTFVVETSHYNKLLLLTDCALNIDPDLSTKQDIVQNAIELACALGIAQPKVAILSAIETVTDKLQSTLDAAALCKMADRGQIVGGILDGPLGFDNAISKEAAIAKNIDSAVAGDADILLAPDLEAGNMLAKQLEYLGGAKLAGVVLGAHIPIVLTSRADNGDSRSVSCALGALYAEFLKKKIKPCSNKAY